MSAPASTPPPAAVPVFLAFAFTYFFSALLRAVTATLAPAFSSELGLLAGDLGLLAGAYFFGFAAMQLPLGGALDRFGPRRVVCVLLGVAALGCALFAMASSLPALIAARALIGVGVGACLMAPLTCFRRLYSPAAQLRANSWMLMTGSLGMLASTLPVQLLLPVLGWRGLFWWVGAMLLVSVAVILWRVPADPAPEPVAAGGDGGYAAIVRHPLFIRMAPLGFFAYGGLIAVQSLWAGPWLTRVAGGTPAAAAQGLFLINLCMLFTFMSWGALMPRLARRGLGAVQLMTWGLPLSLALLALNIVLGPEAGALHWALWCVSTTFVSLSQPAVGQAFAAGQAGRALSAFNLVIFGGVFCVQWGIGLGIDALVARGVPEPRAFQWAFAVFWVGCALAYLGFIVAPRFRADNGREANPHPMTALLVVAHAPLASSLQAVAQHVYPDCARQLAAVDVGPEATPEQVVAQINAARERLPAGDLLILTDMFGATPCNAARSLADGTTVRVVSGVNVPMLWRSVCYASLPLSELVQRALDGGTQGVMHVPPETRRQNQGNPPGRHEQDDDPHQQ